MIPSQEDADSQKLFPELKSICVPLLAHSRLDHRNIPEVLSLLSALTIRLQKLDETHVWLKPALISYTFFPLQTILSRNDSSGIPDQVIERIFNVLELLFRWWWWTCEEGIWEQVIMLAGSVIGGLGTKGKGRERDDETKDAAVRLILSLLRDRSSEDNFDEYRNNHNASIRLYDLQTHAQTEKLVPVLGQTLNSLLATAMSEHLPLRLHSLNAVEVIVSLYVPDAVLPSILPGTVSSATRIALGRTSNERKGKGWVNGSVVAAALKVLDAIIIRAIGDDPCLSAKIVKEVNGLEDLAELVSGDAAASSLQPGTSARAYETIRSASWLRASSSQLLVALNSLSSLISHPTPAALLALSSLSQSLLSKARLSLSNCRPLLLSFLLSLSNSRFSSVSNHASNAISSLLSLSTKGSHALVQTLVQNTADNLSALPRLLPTQADARIMHVAGQIEAACRLCPAGVGVGRLLGPTGHIEKWGWRLLAVLDFAPPSPTIMGAGAIGLLEGVPDERIVFPLVTLNNVATRDTHVALERMLRALGSAGGETCLFAIEWFVRVGLTDRRSESASGALWCACRILEGVADVSLDDDEEGNRGSQNASQGRRIEKFARWLTKTVSELWDKDEEEEIENDDVKQDAIDVDADEERPAVEFVKGLTPLETKFDMMSSGRSPISTPKCHSQPILLKSFALQLLAASASILQSRFSALLMHALYPVLHSLVQPSEHLAGTAQAALHYVTRAVGSATPANLLLSNFDYALDAVSRRLTRRHLEIDAAQVLVILVRLVGRDVVQRASDVVEECFDRLDDFHGYSIIVENLIEALHEVVKVLEVEEPPQENADRVPDEPDSIPDDKHFESFVRWLEHRHDPSPRIEEEKEDDVGTIPHGPLGKGKSKEMTEEEDEEEKKMLNESNPLDDPPPTPTQALTAQIVSRSITLLTHGTSSIRTCILVLLATAAPVLPASSLLPAVHRAWPFVVNRLSESETPVAAAAASFVAALTRTHGSFMTQRVWDDVWPLFRRTLARLDAADEQSALARRHSGVAGVGTDSMYTHSHRLYRAMLATMTAAVRGGIQIQDRHSWDVLLSFRRFLSKDAHEELQGAARDLYIAFGENNEDAVWLVLTSTASTPGVPHLEHLAQPKWDIQNNADVILADLVGTQKEDE